MSHPARRLLITIASVLAVALALAGCTSTTSGKGSTASPKASGSAPSGSSSSGAASAPRLTQQRVSWGSCDQVYNVSAVQLPGDRRPYIEYGCARMSVPLNYADPSGQQITLQLVRVHYEKQQNRIGSLLINPGGPGGSGNTFTLGEAAEMPLSILQRYDLVGFDPRGVGASTPVRCETDKEKDATDAASPDMRTAAGFATAKAMARTAAADCSARVGSSLPYFNSVQTAFDMDQIRQAVGDAKMHYLGYSYGTTLGSLYAHYYPTRVATMVLDGAVDPLTSPITSATDQTRGFEGAFDQFATWCRSHSPCSTLGNARDAVYGLQATALSTPIAVPSSSRTLTYSLLNTGVLQALYSQSLWPDLASGLVQAKKGNGADLLSLADEYNERYPTGYTNISDANLTINCNDSPPGPSDAQVRATERSWATKFPMFGAWNSSELFACQSWQSHRTVPPHPTATSTPTTVLVLGNIHDPATPYQGALDLAKIMGHAEVLTWNGQGHTSFLEGSSCVDTKVEAYLTQGTVPAKNTTCPA